MVIDYLRENCSSISDIRQSKFFVELRESIEKIAKGGRLWEDNDLDEFRDNFFGTITALLSTNQMTKLMFKMLMDVASVHIFF
jgi:hypothetical protein